MSLSSSAAASDRTAALSKERESESHEMRPGTEQLVIIEGGGESSVADPKHLDCRISRLGDLFSDPDPH